MRELTMSLATRVTTTARKHWLQTPWLRPFNDPVALNELAQRLLPRTALSEIRARVEQVTAVTSDTRSFVLHANRHWPGFSAGQHVLVTMDVRGRRLQRCFSISSAPTRTRRFTLTVKRQSENGVTAWMHDHLTVGTIITLSAPVGQFSLTQPAPDRILMLSAGSGITPLMAMLQTLHAQHYAGDVVLLHSCKRTTDAIFASELSAMAALWPALKLRLHFTDSHGRLNAHRLAELVPDFAERYSLLCGPPAFADWVRALYQERGAGERLHSESFGPPRGSVRDSAQSNTVRCEKSEQSFTANAAQSLLLAAEAAGLSPRHGCRIGICRSCQCLKRSGSVENLLTGVICSEPDQLIQLCISVAQSQLSLDL
jgi:stearoyl-CoA 9-desaturase NADPH oxidoreductase